MFQTSAATDLQFSASVELAERVDGLLAMYTRCHALSLLFTHTNKQTHVDISVELQKL